MDSQISVTDKGGTMRLGAYPCKVVGGTSTYEAYSNVDDKLANNIEMNGDTLVIHERHRHRFEFNNKFRDIFGSNGMVISGTLPDNSLVEVVELAKNLHPWFVGCQFHPELKSRPNHPHPLFRDFVSAALNI